MILILAVFHILHSWIAVATSELPTVEIIGERSSSFWGAEWTADNLYDGNDGINREQNNCFCSKQKGVDTVKLDIMLADVTQISVISRGNWPEQVSGVPIKVCEGENCQDCGLVPTIAGNTWATVECDGSLRGDKIVFTSTPNNWLGFCEAIVYGTQLPTVEIIGERAPSFWGAEWTADNLFDGNDGRNREQNNCFCSKQKDVDTVKLDVMLADVTHISVISRGNWPEQVSGVPIEVCEGEDCKQCGLVPTIAGNTWATVKCEGAPVRGNKIVFTSTQNNWLGFCEAMVYGTQLPTVDIIGSTSSSFHSAPYKAPNLYDGNDGRRGEPNNCFVSKTNTDQETVTLDIMLADVTQISVISRGNWPEQVAGVPIKVCNGDDCQPCGQVPATIAGNTWATMKCDGGLRGNKIVFTSTQFNYLGFCEAFVYGTPLSTVEIIGSDSSSFHSGPWTIDNVYDGNDGATGENNNCFASKTDDGDVATLNTMVSDITQISVFSRSRAEQISGAEIEVCEGGFCQPCGKVPTIAGHTWATVKCEGAPVRGGQILFRSPPSYHLGFCEVIVYGTKAERPTGNQGNGEEDSDSDCLCQDYHRFCPALNKDGKSGNFVSNYLGLLNSGALDDVFGTRRVEPFTPTNCDNKAYEVLCPKSCEICSC